MFRHRRGDDALHLLLIDWKHRPDRYYLVVFGNPRGAPILEAHKVDAEKLRWRYVPRSGDGRNAERLKRFTDSYGGTDVELPLPRGAAGVPSLVETIWKVFDARRAAEDIPEADDDAAPATTGACIALVERAKFWDECRKGGYICVGWDDVGDLGQYADKSTFRKAFRQHYNFNGVESAVTKKANELWTLRELKAGDIVVANRA